MPITAGPLQKSFLCPGVVPGLPCLLACFCFRMSLRMMSSKEEDNGSEVTFWGLTSTHLTVT